MQEAGIGWRAGEFAAVYKNALTSGRIATNRPIPSLAGRLLFLYKSVDYNAAAGSELKIALLTDHPDLIGTLADWYEQEWEPYFGGQGPADARTDLLSRCNRDRLPVGFVAIKNDRVVGTAAIDRDVTTGLSPSVVGLLVATEHRRRGVASALLEAAERLATELRYDELFISTSVLGELLQRKGWLENGDVKFLNEERGKVYVRNLTKSGPS